MKNRIAMAACVGVAFMLAPALRPSAANAILIELDPRAGALPTAVSANNLVVVGGLDGGGGFYWMPTKGVIFNGGEGLERRQRGRPHDRRRRQRRRRHQARGDLDPKHRMAAAGLLHPDRGPVRDDV